MTIPRTPNLLTTHKYIVEVDDTLGTTDRQEEIYSLETVLFEESLRVRAPHVLEARVRIPFKESAEDGVRKPNGPRTLDIVLWTPPVPSHTEFTPGTCARHVPGTELEQRQLARVAFSFNTKRTTDVHAVIFKDGEDAGISEDEIRVGTKDNLLLARLTEMGHRRPLGVASVARAVCEISVFTGSAREVKESFIDFDNLAWDIAQMTGKPVPKSLMGDLPRVQFRHEAIIDTKDAMTEAEYTATIDTLTPETGRVFTDWTMTEYINFTPADPQHLALYGVKTCDGEETGISFGIDVTKKSFGEEVKLEVATTEAEAREMVSPLIQAATNLRRYYKAATK